MAYIYLSEESPACKIFKGTPFNEFTTLDIYGVTRSGDTHAGCHQYTTDSKKPKKGITPEDVGPKAKTHLGDSPDWNPEPVNRRD